MKGIFEVMEDRVVPSTVLDGGTSTLTIDLANNETFGIQSLGGTYQFTLSGTGTFTSGGVKNPSDFDEFGGSTLTLLHPSDYTTIRISDENTTASATSTNVDLVDSGANSYSTNLVVSLTKNPIQQAIQIRSTSFSGNAGLDAEATGDVQLLSGGITTTTGAVTLKGNTAGIETGDIIGVEVEAPITTTTGAITLVGTSGTTSDHGGELGVRLINGGKATTTSGPITITGTAAAGSDGEGVGIYTNDGDTNTGVTSATGPINISGTVTDTGGGVVISFGPVIRSTGTGVNAAPINITGIGEDSEGVRIDSPNTGISTVDGPVTIKGTTTSTGGHGGVTIENSGQVVSTGAGSISITGDATGTATGAGMTFANVGVVSSTGTGTVTLKGSSVANAGYYMQDAGSSVTSAVGAISITGTSTNASSYAPGIYLLNGASISSTGTGTNAATIDITGNSPGGYGQSIGIEMYNTGTQVTSVNGAITITGNGSGGGGIGLDQGVAITSTGSGAHAATITLKGTDTSASGTENGDGIRFGGSGPQITSVDGNIALTGNTSGDDALQLAPSTEAQIASTGTGSITMSGTSTAGGIYGEGANIGLVTISTKTGSIQMTGTTASQNGVDLTNDTIQSTSGGTISITSGDHQFLLSGTSVTTSGPVNFTSIATVNGNNFIFIQNSSTVQSTANNLNIHSGLSFFLDSSSTVSAGGHLSLIIDYNEINSTGTTAEVDGTFNSTLAATITGSPQRDVINFIPTSSNATTILAGGDGNDSYTVTPATVTGTVMVTESPSQGSDDLTVEGTSAADTITVTPTSTSVNGHSVTYNANLESILVQGLAGNDSFNVSPSTTMVINIDGGDPAPPASPGNTMSVQAPSGQSSSATSTGTGTGYVTTTGGYQLVNYVNITTTSVAASSVTVLKFYVLYGNGLSYDLLANPFRDVPWQITAIEAVFSEPVNATAGSLTLPPSVGAQPVSGVSGLGTNTVTWSFLHPLINTNVTATLASSGPNAVTGTDGAPLDGNPNVAGSDPFTQALQVLYGDVDGDGVVGARDASIALVGSRGGSIPVATIFADVNGYGSVTTSDYSAVRARSGQHL